MQLLCSLYVVPFAIMTLDLTLDLQARWSQGYWVRNMQVPCYSGDHMAMYVPVGAVAVGVFCVLPPMASFWFVWRVRGSRTDNHVRKVYGFLYKRYK